MQSLALWNDLKKQSESNKTTRAKEEKKSSVLWEGVCLLGIYQRLHHVDTVHTKTDGILFFLPRPLPCCFASTVVLQHCLFQKNPLYTVHITWFQCNTQFSEPNELKVRVHGLLWGSQSTWRQLKETQGETCKLYRKRSHFWKGSSVESLVGGEECGFAGVDV